MKLGGFDAPLDLRAHAPGEWLVLKTFTYHSLLLPNPVTVPAGFVTDLASIPPLLRPVFDQNDASRQPAVLHDWLYCSKNLSRSEADALFLEALAHVGVGRLRRLAMYAAVRAFGGRYWGSRNGLKQDDFALLPEREESRHG